MNIKKFTRTNNEQITKNFKSNEFACKDGSSEILIDIEMTFILQKLRDIGGVININSAYRTESYNKKVGGATHSYHCKGQAFDIVSENLSLIHLCQYAYKLGVRGIIKYPTFVHIDNRTETYIACNNGQRLNVYSQLELPFIHNVKLGVNSNEVGIVQYKLKRLGYYSGIVDGICGIKTQTAIINFQKNNLLTVDGICGKKTYKKLFD